MLLVKNANGEEHSLTATNLCGERRPRIVVKSPKREGLRWWADL
jgi:hypothetical protein